jgi:hypothetical protein
VERQLTKSRQDSERDPVILAHEFSKSLQIPKRQFKLYTGTHYLEQAKYVSIHFPAKWDKLNIYHLTDMQHGHTLCKEHREDAFIEHILEAENRFAVLGGDCVDAWRLGSPGSPYENTGEPQSQVRGFCRKFAPIAHRILGYVGGNHERRATIGFGDLGSLISSILGIPYSAGQQYIDIHFGDWKPFRIDLWHGRGAARTKGAKANMVHEFMLSSDANLCLVGHLHDPICLFRWRRVRDGANLKPTFEKQGGAMSSSFLEWTGSYAEVAGLPMTDCMMATAEIYPNRHWQLNLR